jgi:hypothetical protein
MEGFLTTVITDVDAYRTETLGHAGLPEPEVRYRWLPEGSTVRTACSDATGQALQVTDRTAAYCPADDTIYISKPFAEAIYAG